MGKIPNILRENIARNIRENRVKKFPGRGGGKKCAETFGVSPQQWSPWERGMRTPDETRLQQIADFFGTTVEDLRRDNSVRVAETFGIGKIDAAAGRHPLTFHESQPPSRESDPDAYRVPSLRRDEGLMSLTGISDLAGASARLIGLIGFAAKGVTDGRFEAGKTIVALRALGDILDERLHEAENQLGRPRQPLY